jgi:RNA polymerase sigma factor (sigma-70 family)
LLHSTVRGPVGGSVPAGPYHLSHPASDAVVVPALPIGVETGVDRAAGAAFEELYRAAFPKVYAFIRSQVSTIEIAQELVGRIFLKAYAHRFKTPTPGAGAMQWTFRIAHTTLIDYWRVEKKRESASLPLDEIAELPTRSDNPEAAYERKQRSAHIVRVMSHLSDDDRTMLALKFVAQRTNREIAAILSLSEGAVSMRLLRALRRLREQLHEMGWP